MWLGLLIKYGVPVLITILDKTGAASWAERVALKAGYGIIEGVSGLKRFDKPTDYPNAPPQERTPNNLTNKSID
jgi:hypothetical protein